MINDFFEDLAQCDGEPRQGMFDDPQDKLAYFNAVQKEDYEQAESIIAPFKVTDYRIDLLYAQIRLRQNNIIGAKAHLEEFVQALEQNCQGHKNPLGATLVSDAWHKYADNLVLSTDTVLLVTGELCERSNDWKSAEAVYSVGLSQSGDPYDQFYNERLGVVAFKQGNLAKAFSHYDLLEGVNDEPAFRLVYDAVHDLAKEEPTQENLEREKKYSRFIRRLEQRNKTK